MQIAEMRDLEGPRNVTGNRVVRYLNPIRLEKKCIHERKQAGNEQCQDCPLERYLRKVEFCGHDYFGYGLPERIAKAR